MAPRLPSQRPMTSPRSSSVSPVRSGSRTGRPASASTTTERSPSISSTNSSVKNLREDSGTESDQMEKPEVSLDDTPQAAVEEEIAERSEGENADTTAEEIEETEKSEL